MFPPTWNTGSQFVLPYPRYALKRGCILQRAAALERLAWVMHGPEGRARIFTFHSFLSRFKPFLLWGSTFAHLLISLCTQWISHLLRFLTRRANKSTCKSPRSSFIWVSYSAADPFLNTKFMLSVRPGVTGGGSMRSLLLSGRVSIYSSWRGVWGISTK